MLLAYTATKKEVKLGDVVRIDNDVVVVEYFRPPHKPASQGKVTVRYADDSTREYYVSVIGAEWLGRTDQ